MRTHGIWLSDVHAPGVGQPCAAWLTEPTGFTSGLGVLILPPIGYESSSSHRLWRTLAEQAAGRGAAALRLDYWATGDSTGHAREVVSLAPWRRSVATAAAYLRGLGADRLVVVGCQLGAALSLLDAPTLAAVGIVAVAPTLSGRRFVRGLSVLGIRAPDDVGGLSVGGHYFSAAVLEEIDSLTVSAPDGVPLLQIDAARVAMALQRPAEEAEVPAEVVGEILAWIETNTRESAAAGSDRAGQSVVATSSIMMSEQGVVEEFVSVGPSQLVGVLTTPGAGADRAEGLYVLVNSGSDPHVGPGRAWVELARHLAATGMSTLRVDLRGWGESPDGPTVPGRPYDAHGVDDIVALVQALHDLGNTKVVLGGLCAGAWISLAAALRVKVAGSVVLNPQLYWQPGDPVEALMSITRARRRQEIVEIKDEGSRGRWDAEDESGVRTPAGDLLDALVRSGQLSSMLFVEDDDGLEYLRDRLGRRLAAATSSGRVRIVEVADIDHGMHRTWRRNAVFDAVATELRNVIDSAS